MIIPLISMFVYPRGLTVEHSESTCWLVHGAIREARHHSTALINYDSFRYDLIIGHAVQEKTQLPLETNIVYT